MMNKQRVEGEKAKSHEKITKGKQDSEAQSSAVALHSIAHSLSIRSLTHS